MPVSEYGYGSGQFAGQPLPAGTHLDQRSDHKSLHDMIAGTVVLHDPNKVLSS